MYSMFITKKSQVYACLHLFLGDNGREVGTGGVETVFVAVVALVSFFPNKLRKGVILPLSFFFSSTGARTDVGGASVPNCF